MRVVAFLCLVLLVSCGQRPFKDWSTVEHNGVKFKVVTKADMGFVWRYEYYEEVTLSDGTKKWILTERDQE